MMTRGQRLRAMQGLLLFCVCLDSNDWSEINVECVGSLIDRHRDAERDPSPRCPDMELTRSSSLSKTKP